MDIDRHKIEAALRELLADLPPGSGLALAVLSPVDGRWQQCSVVDTLEPDDMRYVAQCLGACARGGATTYRRSVN